MPDRIPVLDHGYVRLVDHMGDDLAVANDAKVSFDKEATELRAQEERLIAFLGREGHTSPFRHQIVKFEVYAPLMVARQWWKYSVGSDHTMDAWNESSRRYITEEPTFYLPSDWRGAPVNRKQGSGATLDAEDSLRWQASLDRVITDGLARYNMAIEAGVAPEQARLFLPAYAMYVRWRWTASLQSVSHFLNQRLADDAQHEISLYAQAVQELVDPLFPNALKALLR